MRRVFLSCLVLVVGLSLCGSAQSLGDVARQTRAKEKSKGTAKKKVITNEDIPESPNVSPGEQETIGPVREVTPAGKSNGQSAEEWKDAILAQKRGISALQADIDRLSSSIRFVEANAYVNGVQYNQYQVKKQQQVENLKTQLAEQKKKLEEMQEAAKKAGMGSAVYDP